MKYYLIIIISIWTILLNITHANFVDIVTNSYKDDINQLQTMKIIQWYPGNLYKPEQGITRAEILKILMLSADITITTWTKSCFKDIKISDRYTPYICTAKSMSIIKWYDDNTFQPNQKTSFVEGIKIAVNSFWIKTRLSSNQSHWFSQYIDFVHENSIFSKYSVYPQSTMTRGMMAHLVAIIINQKTQQRSYIRQNNSLWCKQNTPSLAPSSVTVYGKQRSIITDIGRNYSPSQPTKLIIAFHWRTNPNTLVRTYYKINQASQGNAIIVYPLGLPEEWPTRSRNNPWDKPNNLRDYALFDTIVKTISDQYCINKDEIYVVGHSLGWWFTNTLACARGDIIRAIWSVGGSSTKTICSGPTSAIIMHNPDDNLASFAGGEWARDALLQQNQCWPETESIWPEWWNCIKYTNCIEWSSVVRCPHNDSIENGKYYPHTRPDFAGQTIRDFFTDRL